MKAPQIIVICLYAFQIGVDLVQHGKPRTGNYNVIITIIATGISVGLLIWGGFFK